MSAELARRRLALTVGQRLFLGLLPSLLALALVVALAYWGEYGRSAPGHVVVGAAVLAVVSLLVTWGNTRYVGGRIARLAGAGAERAVAPRGTRDADGAVDELDRIEQVVDELGSTITVLESERARADRAAAQRLHEHATMLSATVRSALAQLDDVRLPLHILLDARFGDVNENQEELLGAARDAADAMDGALRRLAQVADADRGALPVQREPVQVNDVVRGVLPLAHAAAERRGGRLDVALEPGLPRVHADRVRLAEALALLFDSIAASAGAARALVVTTARDERRVAVTIALAPAAAAPDGGDARGDASDASDTVLAARLVEAQGGRIERSPDGVTIHLG